MNEKEKEALREMKADILRNLSNRIDAMLSEPEKEPKEKKLGSYNGWLELWRGPLGLHFRSSAHPFPVAMIEAESTIRCWLAELLEAQRPRVYKTGDLLPERYLWWYAAGKRWSLCEMAYDEYDGMVWRPLPPDYEEEA